jgi:hypothetical protein
MNRSRLRLSRRVFSIAAAVAFVFTLDSAFAQDSTEKRAANLPATRVPEKPTLVDVDGRVAELSNLYYDELSKNGARPNPHVFTAGQDCRLCHVDPFTHGQNGGSNAGSYLIAALLDGSDQALGASLEPLGEPLRTQLGIPTGEGVLVSSLSGDSPAALAGLKPNDILLALDDKPLSGSDDLAKQLKAAGESPVLLKGLRAGKPLTLRVRPVYRVTIGAAEAEKQDYYIGVAVSPAEDALRAHIDLPAGAGLVVTEVVKDSPAEKAGLKANDIFLEIGGKPLDRPETLVECVRAAEKKPLAIKLLRAGKPLTIEVTPALRKQPVNDQGNAALRLWTLKSPHQGPWPMPQPWHEQVQPFAPNPLWRQTRQGAAPEPAKDRLDNLEKELKSLRKTVDEIRDLLKANAR